MDSTPNPNPTTIHQPQPISSIPFPSTKLPIKRKTPPNFSPKLDSTDNDHHPEINTAHGGETRPPPFKFHRIWTEPDEIRFLQGLLDCSSQDLSFPRDLGLFYARFSNTMSQPYTKSQLSEKLRRLRKKFRVISSRLSKGLEKALLSPQDRALYDLSEQLWHPDYSKSSPFSADLSNRTSSKSNNLIGVKVRFSPSFHSHSNSTAVLALPSVSTQPLKNCSMFYDDYCGDDEEADNGLDVKLSEVNVELEDEEGELPVKSDFLGNNGVVKIATNTLVDVFDQSLKEVRMVLDEASSREEREKSFEKRWHQQRIAEFEVLAKRLKLVVEHSPLG